MRSCITAILIASICFAETWRVPDEAPTIQAAFDSTADRDTIRVTIGSYAEALTAPAHFVYLIGDTATIEDSLHRPVIDPSPHDSSMELSCLRLPSGSAVSIERLVFRNGDQMFPRNRPGGIVYATYDSIIVRDCLFDSVYHGLFPYDFEARPYLVIERCEFIDMRYSCGNLRGPAVVRDCFVHGDCVSGFGVFDSSLIENCQFSGSVQNSWLESYRHDTAIRNNIFGPGIHGEYAMYVYSREGNDSILYNTFNCTGAAYKLGVTLSIGPPVICRGNTITDSSVNANHVASMFFDDNQGNEGIQLLFTENTIRGGGAVHRSAKGIYLPGNLAGVDIRNNRFESINAIGSVIMVDSNAFHHHFQQNYFSGNDYALRNRSGYSLNARFNWWGDSSGPYHAILNPDALGDSVNSDHPIDFDPWLTDTSLWSGIETERIDLPSEFRMTAFPNPTNATVSILFSAPRQTEVELKLFNILGSEIETLWNGKVEGFKSLNFDFSNAATGIYFVRAVDEQNATLATQKIVLLK